MTAPMTLPRLAGKEWVILRLLMERGPMYGMQLVRANRDELKRGTVYVTLKRMIAKGYVETHGHEDSKSLGGRRRPRYRPTRYGARVLETLVLASVMFEGNEGCVGSETKGA